MARRLRTWLHNRLGRKCLERDLADEVAFHLDARTEHWRRQGLSPNEAARQARLEFGGLARQREDSRDALGSRWIADLGRDAVYGWRALRAAPAFTAVSVTILAIAIGANTAVLSVLETVMFRMLPVERPRELRELAWVERRDSDWQIRYDGSMRPWEGGDLVATSFSYPVYAQLRDRSTVFADLFLFDRQQITVGVAGREQRLSALLVSGNFFRGLGVTPMLGRAIEPEDDGIGAPPVTVLTYRAARRLFGDAAETPLGQLLHVNGRPAVVVGMTPPAFYGVEPGSPIDLMLPITALWPAIDTSVLSDTHRWSFRVMGRVRPGIDARHVQSETEALVRQALPAELAGAARPGLRRVLVNAGGQGLDSLRRNYARPLSLLMAIMAAVLFIACANIAGLLLTRAAAREREMGLRVALGAVRARVVRQVLTESVLLAGIGGVLGTALALALRNDLLPLLNRDEDPIDLALGGDLWLALVPAGLCLLVALLCGSLPAIRTARLGLSPVLKRTMSGGPTARTRLTAGRTLVAAQVALSVVLLVGAGLFTQTVVNLRSQALGFSPDRLWVFRMDATASGYEDVRLLDFYERVLGRLAAVPGVRAAALSRYGLLAGGYTRDGIVVPGAPEGDAEIGVHIHYISPDYFETMGIPVVAGRAFGTHDREAALRVAIANQALASRVLATSGGAALGGRVLYERPDGHVEIVGIVGDARFASLREAAPPTLYLPYRQYPQHEVTFAVSVEGDLVSVAPSISQALAGAAPDVPVYAMQTQEQQIAGAIRQERIFAYVVSGFGVLAVLLTCLGIYGTLAYVVARRTPEIGLRMALGADGRRVTMMVLGESLIPVLIGAGLGLMAAGAGTRSLESMLFGLTPTDRWTLAIATLAVISTALAAAWLPCRRASSLDPVTALRQD